MSRLLKAEGLEASVVGIYNFLRRYEENGHIKRMPGSGRPSKVTVEVKDIVEAKMQEDDETTAVQLKCYLDGKYCKPLIINDNVFANSKTKGPHSLYHAALKRTNSTRSPLFIVGYDSYRESDNHKCPSVGRPEWYEPAATVPFSGCGINMPLQCPSVGVV